MDEVMIIISGEFTKSFEDMPVNPGNMFPTITARVANPLDTSHVIKCKWLVDSGAGQSSLDIDLIRYLNLPKTWKSTDAYTSNGIRKIDIYSAAFDFMVSGLKIIPGEVGNNKFAPEQNYKGILGWDFLHAFSILLDPKKGIVRLEKA